MNKNDNLFITSTPRPFSTLSRTIKTYIRNRTNEHNKLFSNISLQNATINEIYKEKLIHNMFISSFGGNSKLMNYLSERTNVRNQPLVKMLLMSPREVKLQEQKKLNQLKLISPRTSDISLFKVQRWVFERKKKDESKSNSNNNSVVKYTKIRQLKRTKSVNDMNLSSIRKRIIIKGRSIKSYVDKKGNNNSDSSFGKYSKLKNNNSLNSSSYSSHKYGLGVINGYNEGKNISVCIRKKNEDIKYLQEIKKKSIANSRENEQM